MMPLWVSVFTKGPWFYIFLYASLMRSLHSVLSVRVVLYHIHIYASREIWSMTFSLLQHTVIFMHAKQSLIFGILSNWHPLTNHWAFICLIVIIEIFILCCRCWSGTFHQILMNQLVSLWNIFFSSTIQNIISLIRFDTVTSSYASNLAQKTFPTYILFIIYVCLRLISVSDLKELCLLHVLVLCTNVTSWPFPE